MRGQHAPNSVVETLHKGVNIVRNPKPLISAKGSACSEIRNSGTTKWVKFASKSGISFSINGGSASAGMAESNREISPEMPTVIGGQDGPNYPLDQLYDLELRTDSVISTIIHTKKEWEGRAITPIYQIIKKEGKRA